MKEAQLMKELELQAEKQAQSLIEAQQLAQLKTEMKSDSLVFNELDIISNLQSFFSEFLFNFFKNFFLWFHSINFNKFFSSVLFY